MMTSASFNIKDFFLEESNKVPPYLKQLSNDLYEMYLGNNNTDFSISTVGNEKFQCHKAILSARSPFFNQVLDILEFQHAHEYHAFGIDWYCVNAILDYIYSGDLKLLPFQQVPFSDLYEVAHNYQLFPMKDFLVTQLLPDKPPVYVKELHFRRRIQNVQSSGLFTEREWEDPNPKFITIGPDRFEISIRASGARRSNGYFSVYLTRQSDRDIVHEVSLDVSILDKSKRKNFLRRLDYVFVRDGDCGLPFFVKKDLIEANKRSFLTDDSLIFNFAIEISFYDSEPEPQRVFKIKDRTRCSKALMEAYLLLSSDLVRLFRSGNRSNLVLDANGANLMVHKCILEARSLVEIPLLRNVIAKLSLTEATSFFLFMYSGDSKYLNEHAEKVHQVVISLKLDSLRLFYSGYMSATLAVDNVQDRLGISDLCRDVNLI